jgi:arylsulfatase A
MNARHTLRTIHLRRAAVSIANMLLGCLMLAMALSSARQSAAAEAPPKRPPNIVFILMDDLGYGDIGCYGQKIVPTPNLDRMAAEGMRFTDAYAGSCCCAPSRCSFNTGLHAGHMTVRNNGGSLDTADMTIATLLKKAGYATGGFGKWHLGRAGSEGDPNAKGFDLFFGLEPGSGGSLGHFNETLYRNGKQKTIQANLHGAHGAYGDDLYLSEALQLMRENRAKPFFIYLALRVVHKALEAPDEDMQQFVGKFKETPFDGDGQVGPCPTPRAARAAMIAHMDRKLALVFSTLRELGLERNTLVLFTSDNGPATAGGADPDFFGSAGGLRGYKFSMYEGGIREPLIAWWPGTVPAGSTCALPCAFCDFMPTFAELSGVDCPQTDGISIVPSLKGNLASQNRHEYFYWERSGVQAVRAGDWKAVQEAATGAMELFNLKDDPVERNNLVKQQPDVAARMRAIMKEAHVDNPRYPLTKEKKSKKAKKTEEKQDD